MINKKLETGTCLRAWNYETGATVGQTIGIKNSNGDYEAVIHVESVRCDDEIKDRIVIKKSSLEKLGFIIIEE